MNTLKITSLVIFLSSYFQAFSNLYITTQNGNWMSNPTWLNNNKPDPEDIGNNDTILIYHDVTLQGKDLIIDGNINTLVQVIDGSIKPNGNGQKNLNILNGTLHLLNSEIKFRELSLNGLLYMESSCLTLSNGDMNISQGLASFNSSCIMIENGSINSSNSSNTSGTISSLYVPNGNIVNSNSTWTAAINNYHISGSNNISPSLLNSFQTSTWMDSYFLICNCSTISQVISTTNQPGVWSDPNIWSNGVPSGSDDITISHNIFLDDDFSISEEGKLTISSSAKLEIEESKHLFISGTLENSGEIDGSIKFNGTAPQSSFIGIVNNVIIENNLGVSMTGNATITSLLHLSEGVLTTNNHEISIRGDSNNSALVVHNNGSILGDVTVSQFVPESGYGHHYLSTPIHNTLIDQLNDDFSLNLNGSFPYLYYYNEPTESWVSPTNLSDSMKLGKGYTGYFSANKYVDVTGQVNSGLTEIQLTASGNGWNFIGNPYPSPIDWDLVSLPQGVLPAIYVWDHTPGSWGKYTTYVDGVSTNGGSNYIPLMQSFFVRSRVGAAIPFENNCRVSDPNINLNMLKSSNTNPLIRIEGQSNNSVTECLIRYKAGATHNYDEEFDALLFEPNSSYGIQLSTFSQDEHNLVINTIPDYSSSYTIPLYYVQESMSISSLKISELENFTDPIQILIHDEKQQTVSNITNQSYEFLYETSDDPYRFYLEIAPEANQISEVEGVFSIAAYIHENQINLALTQPLLNSENLEIFNISGKRLFEKQIPAGQNNYTIPLNISLPKGFYILALSNKKKSAILSVK